MFSFLYIIEYINCTDRGFENHISSGFDAFLSYHDITGDIGNATTTPANPSDSIFHQYWDLQKTVPFFLLIVLLPLINFKSPTFFTKFNALGTSMETHHLYTLAVPMFV